MNPRGLIVYPDGTYELAPLEPTVNSIQDIVEGEFTQVVTSACQFYFRANGAVQEYDPNEWATRLARRLGWPGAELPGAWIPPGILHGAVVFFGTAPGNVPEDIPSEILAMVPSTWKATQ